MCLAVYLASDSVLRTSEWDKASPGVYVTAVPAGDPVLRQFRYPHVYYVGSREGCGCGFARDGLAPEDIDPCQEDYNALQSIIASTVLSGGHMQLFTCWEGEQSEAPEVVGAVRVEQIADPSFELEELHLLEVEV